MKKLLMSIMPVMLLFSVLFSFSSALAEYALPVYVERAWNHLLEHTMYPEELLSDYTVKSEKYSDYWYDAASHSSKPVKVIRVVFQRASEYEDLPAVKYSISINQENLEIMECNCTQYSEEDIKKEKEFFTSAKENWEKSILWENKYGPHELWSIEVNAKYCENWPYVPFQRYGDISASYSLPPDESQIQPDEAERIARQKLKDSIFLDGISAATAPKDDWLPLPSDDPSVYVDSLIWSGQFCYIPLEFIQGLQSQYGEDVYIFDYTFMCYEKREGYYTVFLDQPAFYVYVNSYTGKCIIQKGISYYKVTTDMLMP